jgi:hypothetical protein
MEAAAAYQAQLMAAEMAQMQVQGMLGAPGTYGAAAGTGQPGSVTGVMDTSGLGLSQPDQNLAQGLNYSTGGKGLLGTARTGILDPEAYAASIADSASFRIQSKLTAEAEQMANREGELYERLENSIMGVINEGAALQLKHAMREARNQAARGTTGGARGARRAAFQNAREINIIENSMRTRIQMSWEKAKEFQEMIWAQIGNVQQGNRDFLENLPLTNRAYLDAMGESAKMQMDAGMMAAKITQASYAVKQSQQPVNFGVGFAEALIGMTTSWAVGQAGEFAKDPKGYTQGAAEKIRAGTEYTKSILGLGPEDAEGNQLGSLQGPSTATGMGPIDTYDEGAMGSAWSSILGWAGGTK